MQRILILLFFATSFHGVSQRKTTIYVDSEEFAQRHFSDTLQLAHFLRDMQQDWIARGYYFSGVDSAVTTPTETFFFLHKGEKLKEEIYGTKSKNLDKALSRELNPYLNKGFPFATVFLDSLTLNQNTLAGKIEVTRGPEIKYDSAQFLKEIKTGKTYVYQLLDIEPGELFSEADYQKIERKIRRSSYLLLNKPTDISFRKNTATIFLDLTEQQSNTFQGVLGLQQGRNGKASAIGSLDLNIQNLFKSGKQLKFNWERFSEESQVLNIFYKHPFALHSKITPSFRFDLLRQDTTFITRRTGLGVNTYIGSTLNLFLEFERTNGSLLSSDVSGIARTGLADFERNVYRLELSDGFFERLGEFGEGLAWSAAVGLGQKDVSRNVSLPDTYYDTINLTTNYYQVDLEASYQIKWGKRQTLFQRLEMGAIENDQTLTNELYRVGGLNSLRGFNEKSIFAKYYGISRLELRSFFENQSYVYLFYDQLLYSRREISDAPFGIGLGFVLATSSGQFSFALAAGQSDDQNLSFSELRAHFGYISRF